MFVFQQQRSAFILSSMPPNQLPCHKQYRTAGFVRQARLQCSAGLRPLLPTPECSLHRRQPLTWLPQPHCTVPLRTPPQQQQQQQQQRDRVRANAVQVDLLLGGLAGVPGWALGGMLLLGLLLGLALAKLASNYLNKQVDQQDAVLENGELRAKVDELQQLVLKLQPVAYKSMRLRFTKGINKAVILGMVDQMLANKEVNIWWLPDSIERIFYFNVMTLMLAVLDEVVDGMNISLAGHNVRLQLTYLDVAPEGEATSRAAQKTEQLLQQALRPPRTHTTPRAA